MWVSFACVFRLCLAPFLLSYLELILLVLGAFVKRPVVSEPPDVIELVEAFDVVRHSVSLQHVLTLWDGCYSVDLQVWKHRKLREVHESERGRDGVTRESTKTERRSSLTWKNMKNQTRLS